MNLGRLTLRERLSLALLGAGSVTAVVAGYDIAGRRGALVVGSALTLVAGVLLGQDPTGGGAADAADTTPDDGTLYR